MRSPRTCRRAAPRTLLANRSCVQRPSSWSGRTASHQHVATLPSTYLSIQIQLRLITQWLPLCIEILSLEGRPSYSLKLDPYSYVSTGVRVIGEFLITESITTTRIEGGRWLLFDTPEDTMPWMNTTALSHSFRQGQAYKHFSRCLYGSLIRSIHVGNLII